AALILEIQEQESPQKHVAIIIRPIPFTNTAAQTRWWRWLWQERLAAETRRKGRWRWEKEPQL
ncbi:hypothetical protein N0V86_002313, partial [Didymella sp. IMI 355093]